MQGVIRVLARSDRSYYTAGDIMELLGVSKTKAYKMLKSVRDSAIRDGMLGDDYPIGKCPKRLVNARYLLE